MDPKATWTLVSDETLELDERAEAALDLLVWLANGGFWDVLFPRGQAVRRCEALVIASQETPVPVAA